MDTNNPEIPNPYQPLVSKHYGVVVEVKWQALVQMPAKSEAEAIGKLWKVVQETYQIPEGSTITALTIQEIEVQENQEPVVEGFIVRDASLDHQNDIEPI